MTRWSPFVHNRAEPEGQNRPDIAPEGIGDPLYRGEPLGQELAYLG